MTKRTAAIALSLLMFISLAFATKQVPFHEKNIAYQGRVETIDKKYVNIYWPGTTITLKFKGTEAKAILKNGKEKAYFYAIVDGNDNQPLKISADTVKTTCLLASGLSNGEHTIQLFKLSNNTSVTSFYGFELNDGATTLKPNAPQKRKIEFYGNSITAGHGVDVKKGEPDSGAPELFNNYWTYAARTARHYNAQYSCIARSGIGIMLSWFPEIMPEVYDRIDPFQPTPKWDFKNYTPDIVVINLFQNDSWLVEKPNHPQFIARFGTTRPTESQIIAAYESFVKTIRGKYPNASIICALGSMDATREGSPWPGYIEKAVKNIGDKKIYTHFFAYKKTGGHPIAEEQKAMADDLIRFIDKTISW